MKVELSELYEPKFVQVLGILATVQESMYMNQTELGEVKLDVTNKKADIDSVEELRGEMEKLR